MPTIDHKIERDKEIASIKNSPHPRKVVVGGPGTGKSYLFRELIKKKRAEGKTNFLAITFIGKLGDALADDLCGLAKTTTMHSFARAFVLEYYKGWSYYPRMYELIMEDLQAEGIDAFEMGDENYERKTKFYKAVGDVDVLHYAVQICAKDENRIPIFDLILIDEYQDFNAIESEFVDLLAKKNEIVIVGDDDQALYGFKGSSPSFIRNKFDPNNTYWESSTLRFCSRCTEIIIKYFHSLIDQFGLNNSTEFDYAKRRIQKEFICYVPDKDDDTMANPRIHLIKNCPVGMIAYKIRRELEKLVENQQIKDVLIIGEGRSCKALLRTIAQQLKNYGFKYVDDRQDGGILPIQQRIVDAYRFLATDEISLLGWRILSNPKNESEKQEHLKNAKFLTLLINGTPFQLTKINVTNISRLEDEIEDWESSAKSTKEVINPREAKEIMRRNQNEIIRKAILINELKHANIHLHRPLGNLDVTVCNILNAKGLGADIVFLVGFDQGRFPSREEPTDSEVYQMLVAITRAKKRVYLINTIDKGVSSFSNCLKQDDLEVEIVEITN